MSSNFSWFLRFIIYIPLSVSGLFILFYLYLTSAFDRNLDACLKNPSMIPSATDRKKMVPFIGCLKKKSNFFLTKVMDEGCTRGNHERPRQTDCRSVSGWL